MLYLAGEASREHGRTTTLYYIDALLKRGKKNAVASRMMLRLLSYNWRIAFSIRHTETMPSKDYSILE